MKRFACFVNLLFSPRFTLHLRALFCEGQNYSKRPPKPQGLFRYTAQPAPDSFQPVFYAACRNVLVADSTFRHSDDID